MSDGKYHDLETRRLVLRRFIESDAKPFWEYRTSPGAARYQGERFSDCTQDKALEFVKEQMVAEPGVPDGWFQIAIEEKQTGRLIGDLGIHTLPEDQNQYEIGITINPRDQNLGYGIEAINSLLEYLFGERKGHRVIALTDVRNSPSIHLLEKAGMRKEGYFLQNAWSKGEYIDEFLFALLNEEWASQRSNS